MCGKMYVDVAAGVMVQFPLEGRGGALSPAACRGTSLPRAAGFVHNGAGFVHKEHGQSRRIHRVKKTSLLHRMGIKKKECLCWARSHHADESKHVLIQTTTSRIAIRTSIYISVIGITALLFPNIVIQCILYLSRESQRVMVPSIYVQVGGTLAVLFGTYYAGAAFDDMQGRYPVGLYTSTVMARYFLAIVFGILFLTHGCLHLWVLLLGMMNALSAYMLQRAISRRSQGYTTD